MMMPRMGGEMFYWAVTRMRPGTARRFIFFTGHRNNPAIEFFFERANATVLVKPFELSALDATIQRFCASLSDPPALALGRRNIRCLPFGIYRRLEEPVES
jgi:response regulator RpfG family c-di-GMP phosphodiesterase